MTTIYWVAAWVDALPATISLPTELLCWYCWYNNTYGSYDEISAKRFGSDFMVHHRRLCADTVGSGREQRWITFRSC